MGMRTPHPGPARHCMTCRADIPYPPAGLTMAQLKQREYSRAIAGKPAEFCIVLLDGNGNPANQCTLCAQKVYRAAQAAREADNAGRGNRWEDPRDTFGGETDA